MEIQVKKNEITPMLKKAEALMKSEFVADAAGEIGFADVIRTFQTSGANIGESWKALAELTVKWRRKGKGKDKSGKARGDKPLLSGSAIPFGLQKILVRGGVVLRTNKVVGGVDIAAVHDEGVKYPTTERQRAWFRYQGVFFRKDKHIEIPQRKFSEFSNDAKKEMRQIPTLFKGKITR